MLVEMALKVSTIARRLGFRDPSQFVLDFRRETGLTPGAFRRSDRRVC